MFKKNQLLMLLLLGTVAAPVFGMQTNNQQKTKEQLELEKKEQDKKDEKVEKNDKIENNNLNINNSQINNNPDENGEKKNNVDGGDDNNQEEQKVEAENTVKDQKLNNLNKDENANLNKVEKIEENNNEENNNVNDEKETIIPEQEKNSFLSTLYSTTKEIEVDGKTQSVTTYDGTETSLAALKPKFFLVTTDQNDLAAANKAVANDPTKKTFIVYYKKTMDNKTVITYKTAILKTITANNFFRSIPLRKVGDGNNQITYYNAADVLGVLKYATNLKLTAKICASNYKLEDYEYLVYNDITKQYYAVKIKDAAEEETNCFTDNVLELSKVSEADDEECVYSETSIKLFVKDLGLTLVHAKKESKNVLTVGKDTYMKLQSAHKFFWNATQTTGQTLLSAFLGFLSGFTLGNERFVGKNQQASWIAPYVTSAFCGGSVVPLKYKKTSSIGHPFTISPKKALITFAAYAGNIAARFCNEPLTNKLFGPQPTK